MSKFKFKRIWFFFMLLFFAQPFCILKIVFTWMLINKSFIHESILAKRIPGNSIEGHDKRGLSVKEDWEEGDAGLRIEWGRHKNRRGTESNQHWGYGWIRNGSAFREMATYALSPWWYALVKFIKHQFPAWT